MIFKCVCCDKVQELIKEWVSKVGHDKCWYYPELLEKIAEVYSIDTKQLPDIPEEEFKEGCDTFRNQMYKKKCTELTRLYWYINYWIKDETIKAKLLKRYEQVGNELLEYDTSINIPDNMFVDRKPSYVICDDPVAKEPVDKEKVVNWFSEVTKARQAYKELIDTDYHDSLLEDFQNNK